MNISIYDSGGEPGGVHTVHKNYGMLLSKGGHEVTIKRRVERSKKICQIKDNKGFTIQVTEKAYGPDYVELAHELSMRLLAGCSTEDVRRAKCEAMTVRKQSRLQDADIDYPVSEGHDVD